MKLLRFLILTCVVSRSSLAAEFASLKRCCCPRGVYALLLAVMDHPEKCLEDWFQNVCDTLSWQFDLVNFDQEVNHAQMGAILKNANGKVMTMEQLALNFFARDIAHRHSQLEPAAPGRGRGRPQVRSNEKKKLRSGWHAYVRHYKPTCEPVYQGARIKSGEHLRELAERWKDLPEEEQAPFQSMTPAN